MTTGTSDKPAENVTREYGRTVHDLLRLLRRASQVQVLIARSEAPGSVGLGSIFISPASLRRSLRFERAENVFQCELVTDDAGTPQSRRTLVIGTGIYAAVMRGMRP